MNTANLRLPPYRILFASLLVVSIAVLFWTGSRYPSLNNKAIMEGSIQLEDALSFEALISVDDTLPMWKKIVFTTINWVKTNKNGMIFGILFGAAFLTLIRYLPKRGFKGRYANSALGMVIGAPLGVCVNCAAPIAKGIYDAGARAETTLSAMIASPTLNIVVLTMAFALLPFEVAAVKLGLSIVVILLVVPTVIRLSPGVQLADQAVVSADGVCEVDLARPGQNEGLRSAAFGFVRDYLNDLWYIVSRTVPLMLLAGFLGAVVGNMVPLESFTASEVTILALLAAALIGIFLPVPIGFDVVVAGTLLSAGLSIGFVMVLVFTLGIFSIYSFIIVGNTISWKVATNLTASIVLVALVSGLVMQNWSDRQLDEGLQLLLAD